MVAEHDFPTGELLPFSAFTDRGIKPFHVAPKVRATIRPHQVFFLPVPPRDLAGDPSFMNYRRIELALDARRPKSYPSRRTAWFAFPCRACAEWFHGACRGGNGRIGQLGARGDTPTIVLDLVWRNIAANLRNENWRRIDLADHLSEPGFRPQGYDEALDRVVNAYWSGMLTQDPRPEMLVGGPASLQF